MPKFAPRDWGWLEVIAGPMFSGKSTELIRRLVHAQIAGLRVVAFKPAIDTRSGTAEICSRIGTKIPCEIISCSDYFDAVHDYINGNLVDVLAFDEVQFFNNRKDDFPMYCAGLTSFNKRVIVAGLDTDYTGTPFETMAGLMARADFVDKLSAVCTVCGDQAIMTARLVESSEKILIGDKESYTALCRKCHFEHQGY